MAWKKVNYSRNQINRAGRDIINTDISPENKDEALKVIDNWRAAHAYPLYIISNKLKRMIKNNSNIFVVNRLKRLDSIVAKLKRQDSMDLNRMQDIGGCRVVVEKLEEVYKMAEEYENSRIRHALKKENDYIKNPKKSGYRSLHRIYKYTSDNPESKYNNMLIEIQFRTKLQHLWATAVETMGIYTHTNLKAGVGDINFLRFFALISSLFAIEEGTPMIPNTPYKFDSIIDEIKELNTTYNILMILSAFKVAIHATENNHKMGKINKHKGYYILILNYEKRVLNIKYYRTAEIEKATEAYKNIEKQNTKGNLDTVLVSASSFEELKKAYPNYFTDIKEFVEKVKSIIE